MLVLWLVSFSYSLWMDHNHISVLYVSILCLYREFVELKLFLHTQI